MSDYHFSTIGLTYPDCGTSSEIVSSETWGAEVSITGWLATAKADSLMETGMKQNCSSIT